MQASVVISYYKNIPNLELILLGLNRQSAKGEFEVIISEDDDAIETVHFIDQQRKQLNFPIIHLSQEDTGFRKCKALNKAVNAATTDLVIFIDGDCIPHKHFIKQYIKQKSCGDVLFGRRVKLSEKITQLLLKNKRLGALNFLNLLLTGCQRVEEGLYLPLLTKKLKKKKSGRLLGCNMGIAKKSLTTINGFDEDYIAPGAGEDSDIEWRLEASGATFHSMKFSSIVYHLYHEERFNREMERKNFETMMYPKMKLGFFACKNGLTKLP
ncbi:glycosyltransferase [Ferruginibacter sp. SUN002]|uniref:glycosyltransferase n=1 Tax=Ferruginibacter sp. SUN002 TaxID=2937789 RepID=UPI003D361CDA